MNWLKLLTTTSGRIDVKTYNLASLVPLGLLIAGSLLLLGPLTHWHGGLSFTVVGPKGLQWLAFGAGIVGLALTFWTAHALCAKRLHDRNKSGAWMALWSLSAALILALPIKIDSVILLPAAARYLALAIGLVGVVAAFWHTFELSIMRGTPDSNRYGPAV